MPRRSRVELAGFHHVYNRAVEKKFILEIDEDKEKFLEILEQTCRKYKFHVHSYVIMDNHYHLLLETSMENISLGMRQLNSKYAVYYNKKYKRVGHLWQDRFKSWYILDENYLFTLYKYIELNPVRAKITRKIGQYRYASSYNILNNKVQTFLCKTFVLKDYDTKELFDALQISLSKEDIEKIDRIHKDKITVKNAAVILEKSTSLKRHFEEVQSKDERNKTIAKAFEDGYKQSEIAKFLGLSVSSVSKVIKIQDSIPDPFKICFETLKVEDGVVKNLEFHQKRVDKTRGELFGYSDTLYLKSEIKGLPKKGIFRLRIDYEKKIELLTCKEYTSRYMRTFKLVNSNISYDYKYASRDGLNDLLDEEYDDIIIVKEGLLSDTSIANIALEIDGVWLTPKKPLLQGTTRARLLENGFLKCANLSIEDLVKMKKFAIMNSLLGFKIIQNVRIIN